MGTLLRRRHIFSLALFLLLATAAAHAAPPRLSPNYYRHSCPRAERIVSDVIAAKQRANPSTAAGTLRLFFHDCFVNGCDASVLVSPLSSSSTPPERAAEINLSLPGDAFDAVDRAKSALESACPGVVSCADVLALAARDLVGLLGGPRWPVALGPARRGPVRRARRRGQPPPHQHVGPRHGPPLRVQGPRAKGDGRARRSPHRRLLPLRRWLRLRWVRPAAEPGVRARAAKVLRGLPGRPHRLHLQRRGHAAGLRRELLQEPAARAGPARIRRRALGVPADAGVRAALRGQPDGILPGLRRCDAEARRRRGQDRAAGGHQAALRRTRLIHCFACKSSR
ncbi:hypothetical protein PR202_ga20025 [Eleusine coracana subsp. coracana]|uniref:Peroxidase n=1 Tax=Eleusine coracana subsp. coracana TaxID=191504 RepID=A0AAV5CXL3_ELECO|nr:hypothetical protein PR202_ga20025 [Eleusine coracana subsp. coracana]